MFDLKKNAMLQTRTVEAKTLQLLKELQAKPYMSDFKLARGTALSLYIGHRKFHYTHCKCADVLRPSA